MKKIYLSFTLCILVCMLASAAPRYWVGPLNGNWNNPTNWSATSRGAGGAGVPGTADSVIFDVNNNALINVDISPRIRYLSLISSYVTLYTSIPTVFTITERLFIGSFFTRIKGGTLKDSTSADVRFDFVFERGASASIDGDWVFEGGVPVSRGNGPTFTSLPGSSIDISSVNARGGIGASIILKKNTADISSSSVSFGYNSNFILDNNPTGAIPNASWRGELYNAGFIFLSSSVIINGDLSGKLRHLGIRPSYGSFRANLSGLTNDASLALPHGTLIKGDLTVTNTNNHTLTLLAGTGLRDSVVVAVGIEGRELELPPRGNIFIRGDSTRVTLALATSAAPGTIYRLQSNEGFTQSGGNFSLQDYDSPTGSTTLSTKGSLFQTGGTFFTNSTATGPYAKFIVELDDPRPFLDRRIFRTLKFMSMSGGTIDNGRSVVTLRINHSVTKQFIDSVTLVENGVTLLTPLTVGRLDLFRGPLTTSATNMLTVTDPNATAVTVSSGFVNGPLRRRTNSTDSYVFPVGRGNSTPAPIISDSCVIIPATDEPSEYQAEYFLTRFADTQNVRPPLKGVSVNEYWNISRLSGTDAKVGLFVNRPITGANNRDVLVVARYTGNEWVSEQGTVLSPGDTTAGSVVSRTLSEFGPFTFGYYPDSTIPPVYVNCPSGIIANTEPNSCNALVSFKAESGEYSTVVYKIGSTVIRSPYNFQKGTTTVDVTATDASGSATCSFTVTVNDVQAPVITGEGANPAILSPADDELKNVFVDYTVTDNCGPVATSLSVSSNDPQNANWEVIDERNVRLQAKKSDADIIYTITITSTDESGNQTMKTVTVTVPKTVKDKDKIKLKVKVTPNPSRTYFTLNVTSNSDKRITMRVIDQMGRVKEVRRFYADATIRLGDDYRPGVYYAIFTQGNAEKTLTLIKLRD